MGAERTAQVPDQQEIRRAVAASTVGTVIEWYDFALYGAAAALVIGKLFFPQTSSLVGALAAFATFAVGFLARPLGGFIISHIGDRFGRRPALVLTIVLMGASTVLIGLLPTYAQVGVWAPVLLVLLRLLQGFGAGAELAGAITLVAEYTPRNRRAYYTAIPNAATAAGLLLATLSFAAVAQLPEADLLSWGWRIPFLASALIFLVALYIRSRLGETPAFLEVAREEAKRGQLPLGQVLRERRKSVALGFLSITGHNANAYVLNTFALSFITGTLGMSKTVGLTAVVLAAITGIVAAPLFGMLADRVGRRFVFIFGAAFVAVMAFPFFGLLQTRQPVLVALAMMAGYGIGFGAMSGAQGAFLSELFATRYRYTGIATARELNGMLVAGPTPLIATALVGLAAGAPWLVAGYLVIAELITIVAVYAARNEELAEA
ncbi:MFS family permease [Pseudonocardia eucalypti]|uniref:MFS transporter n=1 Tax=Pseudonocardia eucalypti TaxID=648755 RepID=UPI00160E5F01|nr:MFS family permease [Pseudonocardia eucalypti]